MKKKNSTQKSELLSIYVYVLCIYVAFLDAYAFVILAFWPNADASRAFK